ncbi:hypothetical protein LCGC14_1754730 [marine sediment metagenome]|uniref:Uncharacterized protein n=1 Tax=marine sediment metagenome TaxID=412755 RepID=A0A0F9HQ83_9ZZZZ
MTLTSEQARLMHLHDLYSCVLRWNATIGEVKEVGPNIYRAVLFQPDGKPITVVFLAPKGEFPSYKDFPLEKKFKHRLFRG